MRGHRTLVVLLLKGCPLGNAGQRVRVEHKEGIRACEKGWARVAEAIKVQRFRPVDVRKAVNGS